MEWKNIFGVGGWTAWGRRERLYGEEEEKRKVHEWMRKGQLSMEQR